MTIFPHAATQFGPPYFPQMNQLHFPYLPSHQTPSCSTHILVQPTTHPNYNKAVQYTCSAELPNFPTFPSCSTSPTLLQEDYALL